MLWVHSKAGFIEMTPCLLRKELVLGSKSYSLGAGSSLADQMMIDTS